MTLSRVVVLPSEDDAVDEGLLAFLEPHRHVDNRFGAALPLAAASRTPALPPHRARADRPPRPELFGVLGSFGNEYSGTPVNSK